MARFDWNFLLGDEENDQNGLSAFRNVLSSIIEHIERVHEHPEVSCLIRLVQFHDLQVDRLSWLP